MSIRKVKGGFKVLSKAGKMLSKLFLTRKAAEKRLREIEFFKRKGK